MRFITTVIGLSLSLSLGCVVDREIGSDLDIGHVTTPTGIGGTTPPPLPPPLPASSDPCCVVRGPMALDSSEVNIQASAPSVVRVGDGSQWAVTWREWADQKFARPVIRLIEGDTPGALLPLQPLGPDPVPMDIEHFAPGFDAGRGLLALTLPTDSWWNWPEGDSQFRVMAVDRSGNLQAQATINQGSQGGTLAYSHGLRALALIALDNPEGVAADQARLLLLDHDLRPLGEPVALGPSLSDGATVLTVGNQLITVTPQPDGLRVRTFVERTLREPNPAVKIEVGSSTNPHAPLGRNGLPYNAVTPVNFVSAAVVRDMVVIAARNRVAVRTWVYQPASGTLVAGPIEVSRNLVDGSVNMASDATGGTAAVCYSVGDGRSNGDGLEVAIVNPDGQQRGRPVTVASGLTSIASCDIAAGSADEYLVTYWDAAKETARPSILANRVLVQRGTAVIE